MAGTLGLEPKITGSEPAVLPITPYPNNYKTLHILCPEIGFEPILFLFKRNVLTF